MLSSIHHQESVRFYDERAALSTLLGQILSGPHEESLPSSNSDENLAKELVEVSQHLGISIRDTVSRVCDLIASRGRAEARDRLHGRMPRIQAIAYELAA